MIKLSIIVPVYNVEAYLDKCLNSLVNQTLKDIEIIVVNDGTPDNSQKIIDKYKKIYPKLIKAYKKENGGLSSARNYGIKFAKGEYIAFVDSDDYVDSDMFLKMYNHAKSVNAWIVVCDTVNVYENGRRVYIKSNLHYSSDNIKNYIIAPPMACSRIYKKELFKTKKFKENIFYEDLYLTPSLVCDTDKVSFIEEGLYYYYQRSGSIMKQLKFNDKLLDIFDVLNHNYNSLYDKYKDEVEYLYITHLLRTASIRFLNYADSLKYLTMINKIMHERFPNWEKNKYLKKSSYKLKLICNLSYHKHYKILKLLCKIKK